MKVFNFAGDLFGFGRVGIEVVCVSLLISGSLDCEVFQLLLGICWVLWWWDLKLLV